MPETSEERRARLHGELRQRARLFARLVETFGPQVLDVVQQDLIDSVRTEYAQADLPRRDLDAVMSLLWDQVGDDLAFTVEARTPDHLEMKVTRCIWADELRRLNAAEIGYAFYCCWDEGFCQGVNPGIVFSRTKTLMLGDDCCNHTYDLKAEE